MRAVAPLRLRRHYMIDVETTSLATETAIVSLACVPFSPEVGVMSAPSECLNLRVHWSGGQQPGRHIDTKTMEWWQSRSQRALAELRAPIRQKLDDALNALAQFLGEDAVVWTHPPSFDLAILSHAYQQRARPGARPCYWTEHSPWKRRAERDTRTMIEAVRLACGDEPADELVRELKEDAAAHVALDDAMAQANTVLRAVRLLRG